MLNSLPFEESLLSWIQRLRKERCAERHLPPTTTTTTCISERLNSTCIIMSKGKQTNNISIKMNIHDDVDTENQSPKMKKDVTASASSSPADVVSDKVVEK